MKKGTQKSLVAFIEEIGRIFFFFFEKIFDYF